MKIETSRNFKFEIGDGEYWYGLCARHGRQYPLSKNSDYSHDFRWNFTANQEAQTAELIRRLGRDCPVPAYVVPNPNCCYNANVTFGNGCGCGSF